MAGRLSNKRCLIVGGTGGIGLASARRFLEEGAKVAITGLTAEEQPNLPHALFQTCNAASSVDVDRVMNEVLAYLGRLDVLFHVAGISGRRNGDGPVHECTDEGWSRTLESNLTSVFCSNRAALRLFLEQGTGGCILNMTSVLAFDPAPRYFDTAAYTASKAGIVGLTRLAASSYAGHGIRVNALAPGLIDTPMAARAMQNAEIQTYLKVKQPLSQGAGTPQDCAEAAVFLCSDESRLITGTILPIDAGWQVSEPNS